MGIRQCKFLADTISFSLILIPLRVNDIPLRRAGSKSKVFRLSGFKCCIEKAGLYIFEKYYFWMRGWGSDSLKKIYNPKKIYIFRKKYKHIEYLNLNMVFIIVLVFLFRIDIIHEWTSKKGIARNISGPVNSLNIYSNLVVWWRNF